MYDSGKITEQELLSLENVACPSAGSCAGMYTANTMASVAEAYWHLIPREPHLHLQKVIKGQNYAMTPADKFTA